MSDAVPGSPETPPAAPTAPAAPAAPAVPPAAPEVPPAPPAAPAAPAAPPAPAPLPEATPGADGSVTYEATGDPALDVALGFMGNLGIGLEHPAIAAATHGDFSILKATLAAMGDKAQGWEQMVALGEDAFKRAAEKATQQASAVQAAVHAVAGGEAQWASAQQWAAENATPEEKAELNKLFDSGVMGARAAAKLITDLYNAASGTVVNPLAATRPGATVAPSTANLPLSPKDYGNEARALHAKLGNKMEASPEYRALRQRLAAYRG